MQDSTKVLIMGIRVESAIEAVIECTTFCFALPSLLPHVVSFVASCSVPCNCECRPWGWKRKYNLVVLYCPFGPISLLIVWFHSVVRRKLLCAAAGASLRQCVPERSSSASLAASFGRQVDRIAIKYHRCSSLQALWFLQRHSKHKPINSSKASLP